MAMRLLGAPETIEGRCLKRPARFFFFFLFCDTTSDAGRLPVSRELLVTLTLTPNRTWKRDQEHDGDAAAIGG